MVKEDALRIMPTDKLVDSFRKQVRLYYINEKDESQLDEPTAMELMKRMKGNAEVQYDVYCILKLYTDCYDFLRN